MLRACRRDARPTIIGCRRSKGRRPFERLEERHAYTALYLREEIQGESLVRHLAPFSLFLSPSAHGNGHILNFTKIGADVQLSPSTFMELRAALRYFRIKAPLSFWRSGLHEEVDFIIGDEIAIEFKSKKNTSSRDAKGLRKLQEEDILSVFLLVSDDPVCRIEHGITFIHWPIFLKQLWQNVFGLAPINEDYRPHIS